MFFCKKISIENFEKIEQFFLISLVFCRSVNWDDEPGLADNGMVQFYRDQMFQSIFEPISQAGGAVGGGFSDYLL